MCVTWMCECELWKAKQLHRSFPKVHRIFKDMKSLASGRGYDYISEQSAPVEAVAMASEVLCLYGWLR